MRTETGKAVKLSEYRVPDFLVEHVDLDFQLDATATLLTARLRVAPNPAGRPDAHLHFDGEDLDVVDVSIDGVPLDPAAATIAPEGLTIQNPPRKPFTLVTRTRINPSANTQLSGLYRSGNAFCTQCEAEGFRRMTYFPDRPDVLSVYTTRIEAAKVNAPILLGNGNPLDSGDIAGGRHFAIWHDPHPKPCYLFALVGGDLAAIHDRFVTMSGRNVALGIYVERGKENKAHYAMDALKRAMTWDEQQFGREYDLDVFNIVAVPDFNMGAMENKALNIFNDKYVLATPQTASDADFAHIESVIAHEYFHNWTGNRITCRDWFQLCLKEGLTVYRDQEFSADQRSRPVKRISDVRALRAAQFAEDAGPLAHNVRPELYYEINNFYTATVYQKGAEVIRALRNLIGAQAFRRGMDIYFERYDGAAATIEDFLGCFAESSGRQLDQFMRWYNQAGTPTVKVESRFDAAARTLVITLAQTIPDTPGQSNKQPHVIPIKLGLLAQDGRELALSTPPATADHGANDEELATQTFILDTANRKIEFTNVMERPALSLLREFSAPVRLEMEVSEADYLTLATHDSDMFNRWQALQSYATQLLMRSTANLRANGERVDARGFCGALGRVLSQWSTDPEFVAQALTLPGDNDIAREIGNNVDPDAIFAAGQALRREVGGALRAEIETAYAAGAKLRAWSADAMSSGVRALRGALLRFIAACDARAGASLAAQQFTVADNMTDQVSALGVLSHLDCPEREAALATFHDMHRHDHLVIDKWFALQAMIPEPGVLDRIARLMRHPSFSMSNPNRVRAVVASFAAANPTQFNAPDGSGYRFLEEIVLGLDGKNPQLAARLLASFRSWKTLEATRRMAAQQSLERIASSANLSADVRDIVSRSLA